MGKVRCEGALVPALRKVRGVQLVIESDEVRAMVFGIGHRRPAVVPVSLRTARRLVEAGVPLVVRDSRSSRAVRSSDLPAAS